MYFCCFGRGHYLNRLKIQNIVNIGHSGDKILKSYMIVVQLQSHDLHQNDK